MEKYISAKQFSAVAMGLMACLCSNAYAANDIIGAIKSEDLTLTATIDAVCSLTPVIKPITVSGKDLDPASSAAGGAGTMKVDCGSSEFVGLGIRAKGGSLYDTSAKVTGVGSGGTGTGKGTLTVALGGTDTASVTPSVTTSFTHIQGGTTVGPKTFTLTASTDTTGITQAGTFVYEVGGTAYVK
jgi:hypothetical protein